jgi:hypothetical protein
VDGATVVFRLTAAQQRRYRIGLVGGALIGWSLGVVRLVATGRFLSVGVIVPTLVLTLAVVVVAVVAARVDRVVVLTHEGVHTRWGPWWAEIAWADIEGVDERYRGLARRVALRSGRNSRVLPVPLTGGSILGPGIDPGLDEKLELIRRWWLEHRNP